MKTAAFVMLERVIGMSLMMSLFVKNAPLFFTGLTSIRYQVKKNGFLRAL